MIQPKITMLGGREFAKRLADVNDSLRDELRAELAAVGDEIVSRAQGLAPKRTGIMASKVIWYFGERKQMRFAGGGNRRVTGIVDWRDKAGTIRFTAQPTGSVAHLVERGVAANRKAHFRRETRVGTAWTKKGKREIRNQRGRTYIRAHSFFIPARPFFMPAVQSVGGESGINARLQTKINELAAKASDRGA